MGNFQKNKIFFSVLIALAALFVGVVVMSWLTYSDMTKSAKDLTAEQKKYKKLLEGHALVPDAPAVSLTTTNVEVAKRDLTELEDHRQNLLAAIAAPEDKRILGKPKLSNGSELASLIKQSVDEWTKSAVEKEVRTLPNEKCDFGFRRYIRNQGASPKKELTRVDQQRKIIDFLYKTLADSRAEGTVRAPLLLESIDREPIETFEKIAEGKPGAGTMGPNESIRNERDEFSPSRSFRQPGLVEALSFRVRFVSNTATLRNYINKLRASGRPIVITSIEVSVPSAEITKMLSAVAPTSDNASSAPTSLPDFFASDASSTSSGKSEPVKDERKLIVRQTPSHFAVQVDYLTVVETKNSPESTPAKK